MACRLRINDLETTVAEGVTLFRAAESIGVRVPTSCHEQGKCRECLVEIESGAEYLIDREPQEDHLPEGFRLSCRARFRGPGEVRAHTMRRGGLRILEHSEQLAKASDSPLGPRFVRSGETLLRDHEPVGRIDGPPLGLAVDLGTTTVVLRLEDLESGRTLALQSFENPQRFGGSDIMARIRYDTDNPGKLLQRVLLGYLTRAIESFPADPGTIVDVAIAGNTTMRDLFFGLDVETVGQLPYRSSTEHALRAGERDTTSLEVTARRLRLPLHPEALVYGLPLVSSHVGADAAAALLATGMADSDRVSACMDIGTNTEVFVGHRDRVVAASCPAGPAFEGGGVLCGVPALEGAIEHVALDSEGIVELQVIGDQTPIGICGSGLVDLLSELKRTGRMNAQGRFGGAQEDCGDFIVDEEHRIVFSERDINELAQAKGANAAGLMIAADAFGTPLHEIDRFYLAGGFGRHLEIAAARRIGLIPDLPDERIVQVGNASLEGATRVLRSSRARRELERLVRRVEHVSLETHPDFFDHFVDGCQFEPFGGAPGR